MVKYVDNIDLNGLQILNACLENASISVETPLPAGRIIYDISSNTIYYSDGTIWNRLVTENLIDGWMREFIDDFDMKLTGYGNVIVDIRNRVETLEANPQSPSGSLNKYIELVGMGN